MTEFLEFSWKTFRMADGFLWKLTFFMFIYMKNGSPPSAIPTKPCVPWSCEKRHTFPDTSCSLLSMFNHAAAGDREWFPTIIKTFFFPPPLFIERSSSEGRFFVLLVLWGGSWSKLQSGHTHTHAHENNKCSPRQQAKQKHTLAPQPLMGRARRTLNSNLDDAATHTKSLNK